MKRKTYKIKKRFLENLEDSPESFGYDLDMVRPVTKVYQSEKSSLTGRHESLKRDKSLYIDYENKNFLFKNKSKKLGKGNNSLAKQMAIEIANEVCNYGDHKRIKSLNDDKTSTDCLETGDSSNNHEKKNFSSTRFNDKEDIKTPDCRETDKLKKKSTTQNDTTQQESKSAKEATEWTIESTNNIMSSYNNGTDCQKTDELGKTPVKYNINRRTKKSSIIDKVLEELEALLPEIYEVAKPTNKFSRKKLEVSRKNKLYKEFENETHMSNNDLAKKLREMADAIEGTKKTPKTMMVNNTKQVMKAQATKSEAKLISLMGDEHEDSNKPKVVLADLKVKSRKDIPYSDIKNILIKIFKFKPGEFAGITKSSEGGSYSFLAYEPAVSRCLNRTDLIEQGRVLPWAHEDLCRNVALAATICNKIIFNNPNNKTWKKVASFYLKSLDGDIPCIMRDIIMSVNTQNE